MGGPPGAGARHRPPHPGAPWATRKPGGAGRFRVDFRVMDLREALKRPEGKTLEFKEAMPDLDSEALDFRAASESFAPRCRLKRADLGDPKRRYFLVDRGDA